MLKQIIHKSKNNDFGHDGLLTENQFNEISEWLSNNIGKFRQLGLSDGIHNYCYENNDGRCKLAFRIYNSSTKYPEYDCYIEFKHLLQVALLFKLTFC